MPNYYPYSVTFAGVTSVSDENGTCAGGPQYNHFTFDLSKCNTLHTLSTHTSWSSFDSSSNGFDISMGDWKIWNECNSVYDQTYNITGIARVGYITNLNEWGVEFGDENLGYTFFKNSNFTINESAGNEIINKTVSNSNNSDDAQSYFGWGGTAIVEFRKKPPITFAPGYRRLNLAPVRISTVSPAWMTTNNGTLDPSNPITTTPVNRQPITFVPGYKRMSLGYYGTRPIIIPPYLQEPRPFVYPGNFSVTTSTPTFPTIDPTYNSTTTNGQLTAINPTNNGGSYPSNQPPPTIAVTPPKQTATSYGTCNISNGSITALVVGNSGSGYTQAPTITITGGGGSGATATANINNGKVTSITITNGGSGYTSCPTVTFSPPGGNATPLPSCTITNGAITAIPVGDGGVGYTQAPTATLTGGGGTGATATTTIDSNGTVISINITNGGSGYTSCPSVAFTFPTETATAGACTITNGAITDIPLDFVGNGYTTAPTVTLSGGGGTGAIAVATIHPTGGFVTGITITNGGSGYTSCPTIILSSPPSQPPATPNSACTITNGAITAIPIGNVGNGYVKAPTVTLTGGGGSGATATTSINSNGEVTSINITNGGTGYTSCPTVVISSPQKPPIVINPPIETGHINGRPEIQDPGEGYVDPPEVIITPPDPETNYPPVPPHRGPIVPPVIIRQPEPEEEESEKPWVPWTSMCGPNVPPEDCREGYIVNPPHPSDPVNPPDPGRREGGFINGAVSNHHSRHPLRTPIYVPHGVSPFRDKERKYELRGVGEGGTSELYGAIKIHKGLFYPFSRHQLFFSTFKYKSVDTNETDATNTSTERVKKEMGSHNGIWWEVAEYNDCFQNPTEAELRDFLRKFNVIDNDISTTNFSFIRMVGMVKYNGNMLDSNGNQYCLVYCNKSVPSSVTQIQSLAGGYLVLTSAKRIECKYITQRRITYTGQ